jgi:hypothetical protein
VPRIYFDVREGAGFTPDNEGLEFASLDGAVRAAAELAAEIGRDRPPKGEARAVTVELRDEQRQRMLTVRVSMETHWVDPPPKHSDDEGQTRNPWSA